MAEKEQHIEITVIKSDLKKALAGHKKFSIQGKNIEGSILSAIHFIIKDDTLTLETTDGNRALVSNLKILTKIGDDCDFNLSMALCSKLSLIKGELDEIKIISNGKKTEFFDAEYNSTLTLENNDYDQVFPNIAKVTPKKNNFIVTVSKKLIKDISSMHAPQGWIDLCFDPKKSTAAILIENSDENISQQAILMPMKRAEDETIN